MTTTPQDLVTQTISGMEEHAEEYLRIDAKIADLKNQIKVLEREIKPHKEAFQAVLEDSDIGEMEGFEVKYVRNTTIRLNQTKLKTEQPEIYEQYCQTSPSRRLIVNRTAEKKKKPEPYFNF